MTQIISITSYSNYYFERSHLIFEKSITFGNRLIYFIHKLMRSSWKLSNVFSDSKHWNNREAFSKSSFLLPLSVSSENASSLRWPFLVLPLPRFVSLAASLWELRFYGEFIFNIFQWDFIRLFLISFYNQHDLIQLVDNYKNKLKTSWKQSFNSFRIQNSP